MQLTLGLLGGYLETLCTSVISLFLTLSLLFGEKINELLHLENASNLIYVFVLQKSMCQIRFIFKT